MKYMFLVSGKHRTVQFFFCVLFSLACNKSLAQATNKLEPTGNAGIGVITPAYTLDVRGAFANFSLNGTYAASPHLGSLFTISSNQDMLGRTIIGTSGQGRSMYFENNGNIVIPYTTLNVYGSGSSSFSGSLGIGTGTPASKLWVQNAASAGINNYMLTLENPTTAADARSGIRWWVNSGNTAGAAISVSNNGTGAGDIRVNTVLSGTELERLTILGSNGNIGIGTSTPNATLDISSPFSSFNLVGTNTNSPHLGSTFTILSNQDGLGRNIIGTAGQSRAMYFENNGNIVIPYSTLTVSGTGTSVFTGNVGIGTTDPSQKLSVNGNISAKKIIVTQTGWSDYVFDKDYKLKSLSSLESFIRENKHLPEVPSANEIEGKGINLGDTQALLLKKIEELTLYVIAQQKEINKLKKKARIK